MIGKANRKMNGDIRRILVVQTAFIGDVILITPMIRALHELYPQSRIDALVIPETAVVLENNPHLTQVITFDKRKNRTLSWWRTVFQLRTNHYDLAFLPHSSMTTGLMVFCSGIALRIGFDRFLSRHLLTHSVPWQEGPHRIEKNLLQLSVVSSRRWSMQTELFPSESVRKRVNILFHELDSLKPRLVMAPGSVWGTKRWPEEYYAELSGKLAHAGFQLIFLGSPAERELCTRIIRHSGTTAWNWAGETSILESAEIIRRCSLMICNDSGSLHIANAMQTPVAAFFGPTVSRIGYYPYREGDLILEVTLPCRPCGSHGGNICPLGHHQCMVTNTPELVMETLKQHHPTLFGES